jgi:hypothetical protein
MMVPVVLMITFVLYNATTIYDGAFFVINAVGFPQLLLLMFSRKKGAICCTERHSWSQSPKGMDRNVKFGQCGDEDVEDDGCDCDC